MEVLIGEILQLELQLVEVPGWEKIEDWKKTSRKKSWQAFVVAGAPDISTRWLTRAVNKGELTPPPSAPALRLDSRPAN
jgi:hypothetical protein